MTSAFIVTIVFLLMGCDEPEMNSPDEPAPTEVELCQKLFPPLDTLIASHTSFTRKNYPARIKVFQADTIDHGDIVMLGNSLTEQGGNWGFKLGKSNVKNRGIGGDNTDGLNARLNELICRKPSVIFIMIGTNDLFTNYSAQQVANNIDSIGVVLAAELNEAKIIIQTIMPLAAGNDKKSKLTSINAFLKEMQNREYQVLDTYEYMADENGDLPQEYTYDGVHLTPKGYTKWTELLVMNLNED